MRSKVDSRMAIAPSVLYTSSIQVQISAEERSRNEKATEKMIESNLNGYICKRYHDFNECNQ